MYRSGASRNNADSENEQTMVSLKSASDDNRNSRNWNPDLLSQAAQLPKVPVSGRGSDTPPRAKGNYSGITHRFVSASDCMGQPTETGTYGLTLTVTTSKQDTSLDDEQHD